MKLFVHLNNRPRHGYALFMVLMFMALTLVVLGAALSWTSSNYAFNQRNNEYFGTLAAAEAATEKVLTRMSRDFQQGGEPVVFSSLSTYREAVPLSSESAYWSAYKFTGSAGAVDRTRVERITTATYVPLQSQYQGLYGLAATYRISSQAQKTNTGFMIPAAIQQDVQVATIPIFQFAIWYAVDLEINPGPNMIVTGRVHSNSDIYTEPVSSLTFKSDVTAAGKIYHHKKPGDPVVRSGSYNITYQKEHDAGVAAMTLPIGTNNSPAAVKTILDPPPSTESATSAMGKERYYNKADLVILVSNNTVVATSGLFDSFATVVPAAELNYFLHTNVSFYNRREEKTVKTSELDVAKFKTWSQTNNSLRAVLGRDVSSVYIADMRSQTSSTQPGVRVINGQFLPSLGLTVATPNPIYVKGHYNVPTSALGTSNTTGTLPASLVGDAITVLSTTWDDTNSTLGLSSRVAAHTTVNAAFLAGIVPTSTGIYSGGVENFPRFLENWSSRTYTYNGSMVVMFHSGTATAPWGASNVYSPPDRNWTFDLNFLDATRLPPGTPAVRALIRGEWAKLPPNTAGL